MPHSTSHHPVGDGEHAAGPADAPITLVEYGDYQCPYCARAQGEVQRLRAALGARLRFVYRQFPLTQLHPYALVAAEAAEAAGAQGKFWEMHDLLFAHQDALDLPSLIGYADSLGLDVERFEADVTGGRHEEAIRRSFEKGVRRGVNGTPTFFVNGQRHRGESTADALLATIEGGPAAHGG